MKGVVRSDLRLPPPYYVLVITWVAGVMAFIDRINELVDRAGGEDSIVDVISPEAKVSIMP